MAGDKFSAYDKVALIDNHISHNRSTLCMWRDPKNFRRQPGYSHHGFVETRALANNKARGIRQERDKTHITTKWSIIDGRAALSYKIQNGLREIGVKRFR